MVVIRRAWEWLWYCLPSSQRNWISKCLESPSRTTASSLSSPILFLFPSPTLTCSPPQDLHREEDLLRNPNSFRAWWTALQATREACAAQQKLEGSLDVSDTARALLGPLASPLARLNFQRLTYLYESALVHFTLWKSYLTLRMSFVCGKPVIRKRAGDKEKPPEMGEARMEIVGCNI
jgi:pre-mRNA-splicing factor SYF1